MALLEVVVEAGRLPDSLREDAVSLARGYVADLFLTLEELVGLAAEAGYGPGPAMTAISRAAFWADPAAAQKIFLELVDAVSEHAPETIASWLSAACTGLAIRQHGNSPAERARCLAEVVSNHLNADAELHGLLVRVAEDAVVARQATEP
jgi:hypothetical protein